MDIFNDQKIDSSSQTHIKGLPGPAALGFKLGVNNNNYNIQEKN